MDEGADNFEPLLGGSRRSAGGSTRSDLMHSNARGSIRIENSLLSKGGHEPTIEEEGVGNEDESGSSGCCGKLCQVMDKYPIPFVVAGAALGFGLGIGLSMWNPDDPQSKKTAILWIGLLGDLFIRALKCIVLPLVFVSIAVSVMDMLNLGESGVIVGTTLGLYLLTTVCASLIGVLMSVIFSQFYYVEDMAEPQIYPDVRLGCSVNNVTQEITSFLTETDDGSISCVAGSADASTTFRVDDVNGYFPNPSAESELAQMTLSESLVSGLFQQLVPDNFLGAFTDSNFLGIIVLAAGVGIALVKLERNTPPNVKWTSILTIQIIEELAIVFMMFVGVIIKITPFAIISLIASAIGNQTNLAQVFSDLGFLIAAIVVGMLCQFVFVYHSLYFGFIRKNPVKFYKQLVPAYSMAFAASSSAATIPVSLACAKATGQIPDGIANFVIPLGATVNMDGSCIHIICASVWMAYQNGVDVTVGSYVALIFAATFGSMGAAPVPSATIVLILSAYHTAFGSSGGEVPEGLGYIIAIDWFIDRMATMFNISGDLTVCAIVGDKVTKDLEAKGVLEEDGNGKDGSA